MIKEKKDCTIVGQTIGIQIDWHTYSNYRVALLLYIIIICVNKNKCVSITQFIDKSESYFMLEGVWQLQKNTEYYY